MFNYIKHNVIFNYIILAFRNGNCIYVKVIYSITSVVEHNSFQNYVRQTICLKIETILTNATRIDSDNRSAEFGLPQYTFACVPFSLAQLVFSNAEYLFDHWRIFGRTPIFSSCSLTKVPLHTHTHTRVSARAHTHTHTHTHIYIYMRVCVGTHVV